MSRIAQALGLSTAVLLTASFVSAAEESEQSDAGKVEEIIVTATYRETNLMDTPQSISAVTDDMVEDLGAQSIADIFNSVPGLNMSSDAQGENRYIVRGVTSQTGATGYYVTGATVGVYLDGTPVTSSIGPDNQLSGNTFDIERIEVLKGPQGTLFGEGSQGGTIRFLYKQPDPTGFDAAVNASIASMGHSDDRSRRIDGMVNIPVGDSAALRLTAWSSESAGFIDNETPVEPDFNGLESDGARAVLRYEGDGFNVTGSYYFQSQEVFGNNATYEPFKANTNRIEGLDPFNKDETGIYSFIVEVDLDWANFESMTSYVDRETTAIVEATASGALGLDLYYGGSTGGAVNPACQGATAHAYCPGGIFGPAGWTGFFNLGDPNATTPDGMNLKGMDAFIDSYTKRFVQEFRLVSPAGERLRWTAGFFYKDSEDKSGNKQVGVYYPGREGFEALFAPLLSVPANTHIDELEETAIFGEITYDLNDQWEATVGLRYSDMEQYFRNTDSNTQDNPIAPKFVLSWRPTDDLLAYLNYSVGFRPGNINGHMKFVATQYEKLIVAREATGASAEDLYFERDQATSRYFFDGDEISSIEIGVKTPLFDGRAQLAAAAYFTDWEDMILVHRDVLISNPLGIYNHNSGGAEINGFEVDFTAFVTDRFSIRIAGDYSDTEVTTGGNRSNEEGNELIFSPPWSATVMLDYEIPMSDGWSLTLHADHAWVADAWLDVTNETELPGYTKLGARATARSGDGKWRVSLYGLNLTNEEILTNISGSNSHWQNPRQVGLEFGYRY